MNDGSGRLYLIPASLGEAPWQRTLPPEARQIAAAIKHYVVEDARTARAELSRLEHPTPIREIDIRELPERPSPADLDELLAPARQGRNVALMSEAGCPAVADPGALLVARAHHWAIQVAPLVGPSSILLALMASGLNGQHFAFHGYLPVEDAGRIRRLRDLESQSHACRRTQIFIETPYRNLKVLQAVLANCRADTRLCIARDLTTDDEWIRSQTVAQWRASSTPELSRRPAIFLLLAS